MPKVVIRQPHYIDGVYHDAAPDRPAVVDVHEKWEPHKSPHMELLDEDEQPKAAKLGKHFADKAREHVQSSVQVQSEPKQPKGRASDKQPV